MTLPPTPDLNCRLEAAIASAKLAATETLKWFQSSSLIISHKNDQSPVTQADLAAESILREHLLARHTLVAEVLRTGWHAWRSRSLPGAGSRAAPIDVGRIIPP